MLTYRICFNYIVQILSFSVGISFGYYLTSAIKLRGILQNIIVLAIAIGAVYVGHKIRRYVRTGGTAIIGASWLIKGISLFADGFFDAPHDGRDWGYLFGFIALAVLGTLFQLKFIDVDEDDNDQFNKDQSAAKTFN